MNGAHDLGGMQGLGPINPEENEPVFHAPWEKRAFAITLACGALGKWNIDKSRYAREKLHPQLYLQTTYYEKWLLGLQTLLIENNFLTQAEIEQRMVELDKGSFQPENEQC